MKNPFVKNDNTGLVAAIAIGSVAAGAVTYLFTTERGAGVRQKIADYAMQLRKSFGGQKEEEHHKAFHPAEHLKAPKTDRKSLQHHEIITGPSL
ncbi:hypothetical protein KXQ82_17020 [Mucilaginibacter sp. HMF5004]|uniref:YtxH domain-containing protein n=1 Tax=Mucilaginibacter rivuli TaxID=2857527 RepID=UPI001C5F6B21|nr:YtxH domain-containing protein [Mucilaginibacter rivuli]MBW4891433.1 hypothetical protein [Mucilaginibacter rivuli]